MKLPNIGNLPNIELPANITDLNTNVFNNNQLSENVWTIEKCKLSKDLIILKDIYNHVSMEELDGYINWYPNKSKFFIEQFVSGHLNTYYNYDKSWIHVYLNNNNLFGEYVGKTLGGNDYTQEEIDKFVLGCKVFEVIFSGINKTLISIKNKYEEINLNTIKLAWTRQNNLAVTYRFKPKLQSQ